MILHTLCKSCKTDNTIRSMATTRPDLAKEMGETFMLNCKCCGINQSTHVNDVKAKISEIPIFLGILFGIVLTLLLLGFGWIATLTFAIPIYIWRQQQQDVHGWNSYRL